MQAAIWLVIGATAVAGLLAGASLDQSVKQLPARRRIGVGAYSSFSRASDLRIGIPYYGVLGIGAPALAIGAAIVIHAVGMPRSVIIAADLAAAVAVLHAITTAFAAPILFSQRLAGDDEVALGRSFDRFERVQGVRAVLQVADFGLLLWLLVALTGVGAHP
jgi:hypothetical protein